MTVRIYRSTDAGAPVLTGQTGTLVAVLDACLVNGYGAKAAAGWTKAFAAANKAAYQQNAAGANNAAAPMLLYVDDTGPGAGSSREARVCGFETMSAITPVGTGQFPTAVQSTIGSGQLVVRKSNTADATVRQWTLIANGQTIYLFIESGDMTAPFACMSLVFGDFKSYKAGDLYAVLIIGRTSENQTGNNSVFYETLWCLGGNTNFTLNSRLWGHFMARSWTGLGGSIQFNKVIDIGRLGPSLTGVWSTDATTSAINNGVNYSFGRNGTASQMATPNGPDGGMWFSPVYLAHSFSFRGYLPGLWSPLQDRAFTHNDTMTVAAGPLNGKSLVIQQIAAWINNNAAEYGQAAIEYSDTWT